MPEYCTCGAKLVDDARFCHRCGRPTREEVRDEEVTVAAAEPARLTPQQTAAQRLAQLPVSFANPIALRVAFMVAMLILLVQNIPLLGLFFVIWWLVAGWVAVVWYKRLTGSSLSIGAGARLGFITGVMVFAAIAVQATIQIAVAGKELFDQALQKDPRIGPMMNDPALLSVVVLVTMAFTFAIVVGICAAGGALGARFVLRRNSA